jgi:hypothetical protein
MILTYILVDLENVHPQAGDLSLLRGESYRVIIFHGVHQNKFDVNMYKALQPLGDKVELIQSDRVGADVLDFHISFYLGRRLQEHLTQEETGAGRSARFFVISKDKGFDSLLVHVRSLGFEAHRVATIQAAIGTPPHGTPVQARKTAAKKAAPARKAAAKKVPAVKPAPRAPQTKAPQPRAAQPKVAQQKSPAPAQKPSAIKAATDPRQVVLDSLRKMGEKRPGKRKGLEHHIESHLGRKVDLDTVRALIAKLERDGMLKIADNKVEYTLPKAKR